jgi:hypothetical protein
MSSSANEIDNVRMYGVLHDKIDSVWTDVLPYLRQALAYDCDDHNEQDIYHLLRSRDLQLWVAYTNTGCYAMCITQILYLKKGKRLCLRYLAGEEMEKWFHFWKIIKEWAKEQGCTKCRIYGRSGWEKLLKPEFKKIYTVMEAELD